MTQRNDSAFPVHGEDIEQGMTMREYLVGQALMGLAASDRPADWLAAKAVILADAALAALTMKTEEEPE